MTSRLDRLFVLLEAGAGPATRQAAARQLGEVQKAHPEELHRLLARLMKHLRSNAWETRVAAAQAVEAILCHVPVWYPTPLECKEEEKNEEEITQLRCETFDIEQVLQNGAHLMGSEGNEYDMEEEPLSPTDAKERIEKQRQQLNARLGLDVASKLGVDFTGFCTNEDLVLPRPQTSKSEAQKRPIQELVSNITNKQMSSREMNLAKRRARLALSKQKSRDCDEDSPPEPDKKKPKLEIVEKMPVENLSVPDCTGEWAPCPRWPLQPWCSALQTQLFAGPWEWRHGASSALRQLLRAPVASTAVLRCLDGQQLEEAHHEWLEDMALRLLCVLALDRFGDFVSDQVVAPVRETCAQTLGVVLAQLKEDRVMKVAALLTTLCQQPQWEARHGALLGFKYLLAARQELAQSSGALEQLMWGLSDACEDVSCCAAAALAPCAAAGCVARAAPALLPRVCRLLQHQDDVAAPVQSYMALLAALMSLPEAAALLQPLDLTDILPRLWPYLDHPTTAVRKATLQALATLTRPMNPQNNIATVENTTAKHEEAVTSQDGETAALQSNGTGESLPWTLELLQHALRYVYQRILFERAAPLQQAACEVWENLLRYSPLSMLLVCACPLLSAWLCLAMLPARTAADPVLLLHPMKKERTRTKSGPTVEPGPMSPPLQKWVIGGCDPAATMRARTLAANAIGQLSCYLVLPAPGIEYKTEDESPIDCYVKVMVAYLRSSSALQRMVAALVVAAWAKYSKEHNLYPPRMDGDTTPIDQSHLAPPLLVNTLHTALNQSLYYDEVALNCNRVLQEARDLHAMMKHYKLAVDGEEFNNIIRLEQVMHLTSVTAAMIAAMKSKRVLQTLEDRRKSLQFAVTQCVSEQTTLNISIHKVLIWKQDNGVQAALASACAHLHCLPEKLNPVVRPLMESIKKEEWQELQLSSADALAELLRQALSRDPCPNQKVLANLKTFLRCDPEFTPRVNLTETKEEGDGSGDSGSEIKTGADNSHGPLLDKYNGILTLWEQQRNAEKTAPKRGRPPTVVAELALEKMLANEDEGHKMLRIQRRGATLAVRSLATHFGDDLPEKLPKLWEFMTEPYSKEYTDAELETMDEATADELISRFQVIETICECVSPGVRERWLPCDGVKQRVSLLRARYTALRHMCARALAAGCRKPAPAHLTLLQLITYLTDRSSVSSRCGACEALTLCVDTLQLECVPHAASLLLPLLGCMSDHCEAVRIMATRCFATLVQIMPLEDAIPEPEGLTTEMRAKRDQDKKFLEQLFNPKTIRDYKIPVPVSTELRSYQQAGVNWLRFLYEYKLHGVLCDDMGLGKTLQSIVVMAGSHWEQKDAPPSLVICPPTLTGHWVFEVNKFISTKFLKPLQYVGPPFERERLRAHVKYYNLIVASYDIVRKDIEFFSSIKWNYCILDEGHVIKNGKTKAFKAIKQIIANHRLILSGTPIQNNVLELWSLFDFLMPGLLGSARQFTARYCRPILAAREPRAPPHAAQLAASAAEALHRQVLPFLLRRTKEDVLKELPPKITQDYYCELSPLQRRLYERLAKEHVSAEVLHSRTHVFQALHYLQNVCNHPKLVLTSEHPEKESIERELNSQNSSLDDIEQSAKLPALKQLLLDCGIGVDNPDSDTVVSQHRALIFCQLKKMLDIVETDLLKKHLPKVSYLRLDGSVPAQQRHGIVTRFNQDVSYDLLLLTTAVGGLGVNLTGADTVIFVEHDWNPMKDLQAMDRAHRIGQRKVVNVYRLITRNTLEEKIMGLQKFKLMTANTVISSENAAIETMGTDKLLDLFQLSNDQLCNQSGNSTGKSVLETLPELWDDKQYEEEYDMTNFIQSLNKIKS